MNCSGKASKSNSYTPKKSTVAARASSSKAMKAVKGWGGASAGGFGTPKVGRVSFGKR
jgi:hypothetical protein